MNWVTEISFTVTGHTYQGRNKCYSSNNYNYMPPQKGEFPSSDFSSSKPSNLPKLETFEISGNIIFFINLPQ